MKLIVTPSNINLQRISHPFCSVATCISDKEFFHSDLLQVQCISDTLCSSTAEAISDSLISSMADSGSGNYTSDIYNGDNITCRELQLEKGIPLPLSHMITNALRYSQIVYFLATLPLSVFMNTLVIVLVAKFKTLKTVTFYLALQVIVVDLLNAIILFPSATVNAIARRNIFADLCSFLGFAIFFLRSLRTIIMTVLVIDRFCSVFMPYSYPKYRVKTTVTLSLVAWITTLVLSLIPTTLLLDCYGFQQFTWACTPTAGCKYQKACLLFDSITVILLQLSNFVALLLYFILYCKARRIRNRINIAPQPQDSTESDRRTERQKQERRANITFFLLFLALLGVSFPHFLFFEFSRLGHTTVNVDTIDLSKTNIQIVVVICRTLYTLLVVVDPLVILRDRDARELIKTTIAKVKRKIQQTNRTVNHTSH